MRVLEQVTENDHHVADVARFLGTTTLVCVVEAVQRLKMRQAGGISTAARQMVIEIRIPAISNDCRETQPKCPLN